MSTIISSAALVSMFGDYYLSSGQDESNIHDTLREQFVDQQDFRVIDTEDTILRESNVEYAEVIQAFQTAYTPKGGVTFTPEEIPLFRVKLDQLFCPDDLAGSWLDFLTEKGLDRTTWPFVRWFVQEYVLGQISHDLVKNLYGAVRIAPTAGVAGPASASFNGLRKIINAGITAGKISPITTGAANADNVLWMKQIETFAQSIPELYWETPMTLKMSRNLNLRYKRGRRKEYNGNYMAVTELPQIEDFENISTVPRGSLTGVTKIWTGPKNNMLMGFKGGSNRSIVEIEKVDRNVKVYTDFWIGVGFINGKLVFTNDQDLV